MKQVTRNARRDLKPSFPGYPAESKPEDRLIWGAAILIHFVFWISLRTGWLAPFYTDTVHLYGPGCDFFALYQAGHAAIRGHSLYTYHQSESAIPYGYPFRYLPIAAYFPGTIFTVLPPASAYAVWLGVNELLLLYNIHITYQRCGGGRKGTLLAAVWLTFSPLFVHMWLGQFTFVLATLLFWSVLALEEGRDQIALSWWGASILWKPSAILWLPIWIRERRFWPGLTLIILLVLANGLYFLFHPLDYVVFADSNLRLLSLWVASNIGLSALVYSFTGPGSFFGLIRIVLIIALAGPLLWITWRRNLASNSSLHAEQSDTAWLLPALWTVLFFLIYKEVWEQHLVMLLPFLVFGLWRRPNRTLVLLTLLLALPSPFIFYDIHGLGVGVDPQPHFSAGVSLLHHSWRVLQLLMLYSHWLLAAWRDTSRKFHTANGHSTPRALLNITSQNRDAN